jgi:hypothetical protein
MQGVAELMEQSLHLRMADHHMRGVHTTLPSAELAQLVVASGEITDQRNDRQLVLAVVQESTASDGEVRGVGELAGAREEVEVEVTERALLFMPQDELLEGRAAGGPCLALHEGDLLELDTEQAAANLGGRGGRGRKGRKGGKADGKVSF